MQRVAMTIDEYLRATIDSIMERRGYTFLLMLLRHLLICDTSFFVCSKSSCRVDADTSQRLIPLACCD